REQCANRVIGKVPAGGRLPGDGADTIETKQAEFRTKPEVPVGCLRHVRDSSAGEAFAKLPRRVPILADIECLVQRERALGACEQDGDAQGRWGTSCWHGRALILRHYTRAAA